MEAYLRLGILVLAASIFILFLYIDNVFKKRRRNETVDRDLGLAKFGTNTNPPQLEFSLDQKIDDDDDIHFGPAEPETESDLDWSKVRPGITKDNSERSVDKNLCGKSYTAKAGESQVPNSSLPSVKIVSNLTTWQKKLNSQQPGELSRPATSIQSKGVPNKLKFSGSNHSIQAKNYKGTASAKSDLLLLSIVAKQGNKFASYDLLQAIFATGMQFGEKQLFHYYQNNPEGKIILFSLASATKEGYFDLDQIGDFSCHGLILFMDLSAVIDPELAFKLMLKTGEQLAEDLEGELRADPKTPLTETILRQYQQRVMKTPYTEKA